MRIYKMAMAKLQCEYCDYKIPLRSHNWGEFVREHPNGVPCRRCGGLNRVSMLSSPDDLEKRFEGFVPPKPTS